MSRFDYVKYDEKAESQQKVCKDVCQHLEALISEAVPPGRAQSLAFTKLEEVYMWIGKGIRDGQIARGAEAPLQEARSNS